MPTKKILLEVAQKALKSLETDDDVKKTVEIIKMGLYPPKKPRQSPSHDK